MLLQQPDNTLIDRSAYHKQGHYNISWTTIAQLLSMC